MIFVDTGAIVGRYASRDQHHDVAVTGWKRIATARLPCYTTNLVIAEAITLIARRMNPSFAVETGRLIHSAHSMKILRPDAADDAVALAFFEKLADQRVSFTDAVSFAMMRRHRMTQAFAFDRHFEAAGFTLWTGNP